MMINYNQLISYFNNAEFDNIIESFNDFADKDFNIDVIIQSCIDKGANINTQNPISGNTILHIAASQGTCKLLRGLLKNGANYLIWNSVRNEPFLETIINKDLKRFNIFIEYNAYQKYEDDFFNVGLQSLIKIAIRYNCLEMIKILLSKEKKEDIFSLGLNLRDSFLRSAVQFGSVECVELAIESGGNINLRDWNYYTPLIIAAKFGRTSLIPILLAAGADIEARDKNGITYEGRTPLAMASKNGHASLIPILIEAGASLNFRDEHGKVPSWWTTNLECLAAFQPYVNKYREVCKIANKHLRNKLNSDIVSLIDNHLDLPWLSM